MSELLSPDIFFLFLFVGALSGFLAGLLGIGGGVILVPLFLWAFPFVGFDADVVAHAALGTSLAIIFPTSVSSTFGHRKRGNVNWYHVRFLTLGGLFGSIVGATLAAGLSGDQLKGMFGAMQIAVGLRMFLSRGYLPPERQQPVSAYGLIGVGMIGGGFSSFFGIGGGVVAVPLMVIVLHFPIHLAVGNSSALIVASSLFSALLYVHHGWDSAGLAPFSLGYVNFFIVALVAPLTIITARLGVRLASRVPHGTLIKVFSFLLVLVGGRLFIGLWI